MIRHCVYDPVGFFTQVTIKFKIFFQTICKTNIDWDELLTDDLLKRWTKIIEWVSDLEKVNIGRCYCLLDVNDPFGNVQLIASLQAYACVIYLKYIKKIGDVKISLITRKSRVSPLKNTLTICRLELMGNLILSRLVVTLIKVYCFTDSMVTLGWIKAITKQYKTFGQNRVFGK